MSPKRPANLSSGKKKGRPRKIDSIDEPNIKFEDEDEEEEEEEDSDYEPVAKAAGRRSSTKGKKVTMKDDSEEEDNANDDQDDNGDDDDDDDDYTASQPKRRQVSRIGRPMQATAQKAKKTLFIKNLPETTTEEDVRALSSDIKDIRMDLSQNKDEKHLKYAIVEFKDAETAEKNYQQLKGQQVNGVEIIVDYVGGRSIITYVKTQLMPSSDPLKLYVTGFGREIKSEQLKTMFPTSSDISLPLNPKDNNRPIGYAFIHFSGEELAREAHDSMQDYIYQGRTLVVMYGKKSTPESEKAAEEARKQNSEGPKSKKLKLDGAQNNEKQEVEGDEEVEEVNKDEAAEAEDKTEEEDEDENGGDDD